MSQEDKLKREIEELKNQVRHEQIRSQNLSDRAESRVKNQRDKSNEILAIVLVLLGCSVLIILGLTGILN
jgi:molecular chaperone GrpE (heat shock protein)